MGEAVSLSVAPPFVPRFVKPKSHPRRKFPDLMGVGTLLEVWRVGRSRGGEIQPSGKSSPRLPQRRPRRMVPRSRLCRSSNTGIWGWVGPPTQPTHHKRNRFGYPPKLATRAYFPRKSPQIGNELTQLKHSLREGMFQLSRGGERFSQQILEAREFTKTEYPPGIPWESRNPLRVPWEIIGRLGIDGKKRNLLLD